MLGKGQIQGGQKEDCPKQATCIAEIFGVAFSTQEKNGKAPVSGILLPLLVTRERFVGVATGG